MIPFTKKHVFSEISDFEIFHMCWRISAKSYFLINELVLVLAWMSLIAVGRIFSEEKNDKSEFEPFWKEFSIHLHSFPEK